MKALDNLDSYIFFYIFGGAEDNFKLSSKLIKVFYYSLIIYYT